MSDQGFSATSPSGNQEGTAGGQPGGNEGQSGLGGQLKEGLQAAKETLANDLAGLKSTVADLKNDERIGEIKDQVKEQIGAATERARTFASQQKDLVGDQLGGIGSALRNAAENLEQGSQPTLAGHVRSFADRLDQWAGEVRNRDLGDLVAAAQDFGRRQPGALLGIAALAGFAASRFIMASARSGASDGDGQSGYRQSRNGEWQGSGDPDFPLVQPDPLTGDRTGGSVGGGSYAGGL